MCAVVNGHVVLAVSIVTGCHTLQSAQLISIVTAVNVRHAGSRGDVVAHLRTRSLASDLGSDGPIGLGRSPFIGLTTPIGLGGSAGVGRYVVGLSAPMGVLMGASFHVADERGHYPLAMGRSIARGIVRNSVVVNGLINAMRAAAVDVRFDTTNS